MAHIGLNALGLKSKTGGVETYIYNVVKSILDNDNKNKYFLFVGKNTANVFIDLKIYSNLKIIVYPIDTNNSIYRIITENTLLNLSCIKHKLNIVHHFCNYIPRIFFTKSIVTVHDLGGFFYHEHFPEYKVMYNYYKYMKKELEYTFKKANKIIAISEFTKSQILKYYSKTINTKITVIGESLDIRKNYNETPEYNIENIGIKRPYLLGVSVIRPHKNMDFLISVFNELKEKYNIPHQLVIAGGIQLQTDTFTEAINNSPYKDDIKYLGYIKNEILPILYKNASCFIFPSLYEGFGIPLLEAMEYGIPIASSTEASLPEVGGNGCLYFNPHNIDDSSKVIYSAITDENITAQMKVNQAEILSKFNWNRLSKAFIQIYEDN